MTAHPRRANDPEEFDGRAVRTNDEVKATGPGGFSFAVKGRDTIIMVLLTLTLAAIVYFNYQQHREIVDELSGVTYMMSIPADERPRLSPPASLRSRMTEPRESAAESVRGRRR